MPCFRCAQSADMSLSLVTNKEKRLLPLVKASLFTAILCFCSQISVLTPFGVPVTLQTFAISLCGYVLGAKWGIGCTATYILLGAIGLPVFSNMSGGANALLGATGGFIIGFFPLVFLCGLCKHTKTAFKIGLGILGVLLCHIIGFLQLSFVTSTPFFAVLIPLFPILLVKDSLLIVLSTFGAHYINKYI